MEKNVLYLIASVCFAFVSITMQSQTPDSTPFDKQDFMTKRNAYITAEIGLTSDEAVKFMPMENQMKEKLFDLGRECRKLNRNAHTRKKMSNEMYLKLIDCNIETRLKEAQLEQEYYEKFKKLLSPEKLYKYQQAEFKFIREFMRNPPINSRDQRPPRDTKTTNGKKQNAKGGD